MPAALAQETHNFADEIRQHRPENSKQTDNRSASPGELRKRESLAGARLMARAEACRRRSAIAALSGRSEIEARTLIIHGDSLRLSGALGERIGRTRIGLTQLGLTKIGSFEGIAQVNAFDSFHCWQHVGLMN